MLAPEFSRIIVPLGRLTPDGGFAASGAGVLIANGGFSWLVTALHVRRWGGLGEADKGLVALGVRSDGSQFMIELDRLLAKNGLGWVDSDTETDLTAAPVALSGEWPLRCLAMDMIVGMQLLTPSMPCYTICVPYEVPGLAQNACAPLILDGIIAGVFSRTREVFFTAPVLHGNDGCPLLVDLGVGTASKQANTVIGLVGLVLEELLVGGDTAPCVRTEGFELPTRLGRARSAEAIQELLSSAGGQSMLEKVQQIVQSAAPDQEGAGLPARASRRILPS